MTHEHVDIENMDIKGLRPETDLPLTVEDGVIIIVDQAFGPDGDNLVGISDEVFDGFPALTLRVRADGREALVHLSPIHGDRRKRGLDDLPNGTKCELLCPVSGKPLAKVGVVGEGEAEYCAVPLTPKGDSGSQIYVSDLWGHHHSRIVDNDELVSAWAAAEEKGS